MDHFNLLEKWPVCSELGMTVEQFRESQKLRLDIGRRMYADDGTFLVNDLRENNAMLEQGMELMLSEAQTQRLWQIAHYVEIAYLGLDGALTDGRLGQSIGVTENQRAGLRIRAQMILSDSGNAIRGVRNELYTSALSLLTPFQREQAIKRIGAYFEYIDPILIGRKGMIADSQLDKIADVEKAKGVEARNRAFLTPPDFTKREELFKLLQKRCVRIELKLTKEQAESVKRLSEELRENFVKLETELDNRRLAEIPEDKKAIEFGLKRIDEYKRLQSDMYAKLNARWAEALGEVLLPRQLERLNQLSYYAETEYKGLGALLTYGRLGRELGVAEAEYAVLHEEIRALEVGVAKGIQGIRMAAHNQVLLELSTEQRLNAERALGRYFEYVDVAVLLTREGHDEFPQ